MGTDAFYGHLGAIFSGGVHFSTPAPRVPMKEEGWGGGWEESSIEREMLLPACGAAGPILEIEG